MRRVDSLEKTLMLGGIGGRRRRGRQRMRGLDGITDLMDMKKAERRKTDAFELWCWRRLLRVRWTARRSNQSIIKEIITIEFGGLSMTEVGGFNIYST